MHLIGSLRCQECSLGRYIPGLIPPSRHDNESRVPSSPWAFLMDTVVTSCTKFNDPAPLLFSRARRRLCAGRGMARIFGYFRLQSPSSRDLARSPPALRLVWLASNALFSRASLTSRESWNRYTNLCRFNFRCCGDTGKIWWRVYCWMRSSDFKFCLPDLLFVDRGRELGNLV